MSNAGINQELPKPRSEDTLMMMPHPSQFQPPTMDKTDTKLLDFFYNILAKKGQMDLADSELEEYIELLSEKSQTRILSFGGLGSYLCSDSRFRVSQNIASIVSIEDYPWLEENNSYGNGNNFNPNPGAKEFIQQTASHASALPEKHDKNQKMSPFTNVALKTAMFEQLSLFGNDKNYGISAATIKRDAAVPDLCSRTQPITNRHVSRSPYNALGETTLMSSVWCTSSYTPILKVVHSVDEEKDDESDFFFTSQKITSPGTLLDDHTSKQPVSDRSAAKSEAASATMNQDADHQSPFIQPLNAPSTYMQSQDRKIETLSHLSSKLYEHLHPLSGDEDDEEIVSSITSEMDHRFWKVLQGHQLPALGNDSNLLTSEQDNTTLTSDQNSKTLTSDQDSTTLTSDQNSTTLTSDQDSTTLTSDQDSITLTSDQNSKTLTSDQNSTTLTSDQDSTTLTSDQDSITITSDQNSKTLTSDQDSTTLTSDKDNTPLTSDQDRTTLTSDQDSTTLTSDQDSTTLTSDQDSTTLTSDQDSTILTLDQDSKPLTTDQDSIPLTSDQDSTPLTTDQDSTPLTTDQDSTLLTSDQDSTLLTSDQDSTPLTTDQDSTLLTSDQDSTPLTTDQDSTLLTSDQDSTPLTTDQESIPLTTDQDSIPLTSDQDSTPLTSDQDSTPLTSDQNSTILTSGQNNTPLESDQGRTTLTTDRDSTPLTSDQNSTILTSGQNNTPLESDQDSTPLTSDRDSTPLTSDQNSTPLTTDQDSIPLTSDQDSTPLTTDQDSTPLTTDQDSTLLTSDQDSTLLTSDQDSTHLTTDQDSTLLTSDQDSTPLTTDQDSTLLTSDQDSTHLTTDQESIHLTTDQDSIPLTSDQDSTPLTSDQDSTPLTSDQNSTILTSGQNNTPLESDQGRISSMDQVSFICSKPSEGCFCVQEDPWRKQYKSFMDQDSHFFEAPSSIQDDFHGESILSQDTFFISSANTSSLEATIGQPKCSLLNLFKPTSPVENDSLDRSATLPPDLLPTEKVFQLRNLSFPNHNATRERGSTFLSSFNDSIGMADSLTSSQLVLPTSSVCAAQDRTSKIPAIMTSSKTEFKTLPAVNFSLPSSSGSNYCKTPGHKRHHFCQPMETSSILSEHKIAETQTDIIGIELEELFEGLNTLKKTPQTFTEDIVKQQAATKEALKSYQEQLSHGTSVTDELKHDVTFIKNRIQMAESSEEKWEGNFATLAMDHEILKFQNQAQMIELKKQLEVEQITSSNFQEAMTSCHEQLSHSRSVTDELKHDVTNVNARVQMAETSADRLKEDMGMLILDHEILKAQSHAEVAELKKRLEKEQTAVFNVQKQLLYLIKMVAMSKTDIKILEADNYMKQLSDTIRQLSTMTENLPRAVCEKYEEFCSYINSCIGFKNYVEVIFRRLQEGLKYGSSVDISEIDINPPALPLPFQLSDGSGASPSSVSQAPCDSWSQAFFNIDYRAPSNIWSQAYSCSEPQAYSNSGSQNHSNHVPQVLSSGGAAHAYVTAQAPSNNRFAHTSFAGTQTPSNSGPTHTFFTGPQVLSNSNEPQQLPILSSKSLNRDTSSLKATNSGQLPKVVKSDTQAQFAIPSARTQFAVPTVRTQFAVPPVGVMWNFSGTHRFPVFENLPGAEAVTAEFFTQHPLQPCNELTLHETASKSATTM